MKKIRTENIQKSSLFVEKNKASKMRIFGAFA